MPEDRNLPMNIQHQVTLVNREHVTIKGVLHVESFDEREIIMDTEMGLLTIRGEDLNIRELSLEQGNFAVEGLVHSLSYSPGGGPRSKTKGKGFFDRLLR